MYQVCPLKLQSRLSALVRVPFYTQKATSIWCSPVKASCGLPYRSIGSAAEAICGELPVSHLFGALLLSCWILSSPQNKHTLDPFHRFCHGSLNRRILSLTSLQSLPPSLAQRLAHGKIAWCHAGGLSMRPEESIGKCWGLCRFEDPSSSYSSSSCLKSSNQVCCWCWDWWRSQKFLDWEDTRFEQCGSKCVWICEIRSKRCGN